jgi:hypothetical protein
LLKSAPDSRSKSSPTIDLDEDIPISQPNGTSRWQISWRKFGLLGIFIAIGIGILVAKNANLASTDKSSNNTLTQTVERKTMGSIPLFTPLCPHPALASGSGSPLSCLACLEKVLHLGKPQERTFRKPSGNKGVRKPLPRLGEGLGVRAVNLRTKSGMLPNHASQNLC